MRDYNRTRSLDGRRLKRGRKIKDQVFILFITWTRSDVKQLKGIELIQLKLEFCESKVDIEFYFNSETRLDNSDIFPAKKIKCERAVAGSVKHDSTEGIFKNFSKTYYFDFFLPHTVPNRLSIYIDTARTYFSRTLN